MDELAIRVEDVSKVYRLYNRPSERLFDALGLAGKGRFKEHRALDHVTFDVKKGETVGIIGTNGSGKSTILKIITGVLSPTSLSLIHISEPTRQAEISYAVFCLKKKKKK